MTADSASTNVAITRTNYILVDFENTHTIDLTCLSGLPVKVVLFVGENQKSLPVEMVKSILSHKVSVEIFESAGNGKNALDFQIAFFAGQIAEREPEACIHFVTKDKGFDPLVRHLRNAHRCASRVDTFSALPFLKIHEPANQASPKKDIVSMSVPERVDYTLVRLSHMTAISRPRKMKTLKSCIHAHFGKKLSEGDVDRVVAHLISQGKVAVGENEKVTFNL